MTKKQAINAIAKQTLRLETLETRNSDRLDFHDLGVWSIREALEFAYEAGQAAEAKKAEARRVRTKFRHVA